MDHMNPFEQAQALRQAEAILAARPAAAGVAGTPGQPRCLIGALSEVLEADAEALPGVWVGPHSSREVEALASAMRPELEAILLESGRVVAAKLPPDSMRVAYMVYDNLGPLSARWACLAAARRLSPIVDVGTAELLDAQPVIVPAT